MRNIHCCAWKNLMWLLYSVLLLVNCQPVTVTAMYQGHTIALHDHYIYLENSDSWWLGYWTWKLPGLVGWFPLRVPPSWSTDIAQRTTWPRIIDAHNIIIFLFLTISIWSSTSLPSFLSSHFADDILKVVSLRLRVTSASDTGYREFDIPSGSSYPVSFEPDQILARSQFRPLRHHDHDSVKPPWFHLYCPSHLHHPNVLGTTHQPCIIYRHIGIYPVWKTHLVHECDERFDLSSLISCTRSI